MTRDRKKKIFLSCTLLGAFVLTMTTTGCDVLGANGRRSSESYKVDVNNEKALRQMFSEVELRLSKAKSLSMSLSKEVTFSMLDKTKTYLGQAFFSNSSARIEFTEPERSEIIMNPKMLWLVTYPLAGSKEPIHVIRASNQTRKRTQEILISLLRGGFTKYFKVDRAEQLESLIIYKVAPKNPNERNNDIQRLFFVVDKTEKELIGFTYWDEMDNKSTYKISQINYKPKLKSDLFSYTAPRGSVVVDE